MAVHRWRIHKPDGKYRVVVTKMLPGTRWLDYLEKADCRVEICTGSGALGEKEVLEAIGGACDGAIGQLTEIWGGTLFAALKAAGGRVYSNYAVGYNNVDVAAASRHGILVGNTPGVLTETTAEMAVALTFAAARRLGEAERFLRAGRFEGWLPTLFLGSLMRGATLGVIGAGRIGSAYARMMVEGHKVNLLYYSRSANDELEDFMAAYNRFLESRDEQPLFCRRSESLDDLLAQVDIVSLHTALNEDTRHLIEARRLALMKEEAILINTSRGPIIDEAALVEHCRNHPRFRVGLDVFEDEPRLSPGLADLDNVVIVPHIASATRWTREGMAALAAANVAGVLLGYPAGRGDDIGPFLTDPSPRAAPSLVNAETLGYPVEVFAG